MLLKEIVSTSHVGFGTSGARGLVADMTEAVCSAYTDAFLQVMMKSFKFGRVSIGIDLRPSSLAIAGYCAKAVQSAGLSVDFCGALPTPALALRAQDQGIPAIMVTGSHIPFDRNGLKFYRPDGEITKPDEVAMLETAVNASEKAPADGVNPLPAIDNEATNHYIQRYLDFFPPACLAGFKLGLYEHSSVARDSIKIILEKLGAEVTSLGRTDVFIPIDTEAVSAKDAEAGLAWSRTYGFDAIISTDGDGDRPLMSDERGNWLRGDIVGLLCARYLGVNLLAVPVSCNSAIELSGAFQQVLRTRIGSPYVIAAMQTFRQDTSAIAGFEANGGFLLGSKVVATSGKALTALPTRDAVLPVLSVLAAARQANAPVSQLINDLPGRYTFSDRLQEFPTEMSRQLIERWSKDPAAFSAFLDGEYGLPITQDTTDGLRFTFENSMIIHLRPSGNAPELRCYCEAPLPSTAELATQSVLAKIKHLTLEESV